MPAPGPPTKAAAALSHDEIIDAFFDPDETRLDEIEQLQDLLEAQPDEQLFGKEAIQRVLKEKKGLQYIVSILHADPSSRANNKRRYRCFSFAVTFFKAGALPDVDGKLMLETLMANLKLLDGATSYNLAMEVLSNLSPASPQQVQGCAHALELMGALAAHASKEQRAELHGRLCDMASWPGPLVAMMAAALSELSETDEACLAAVAKVSKYVRWKVVRAVSHESNFTSNTLTLSPTSEVQQNVFVLDNNDNCVEPEELPALLFQIASLGRRGSASAAVKAAVVASVCCAMDLLVGASARERQRVQRLAAGGPAAGTHAARIDAVLATVLHHLSFLLCKDDGLCAQVLLRIKARQLHPQHERGAANISQLSPGLLLLALLTGLSPRHEPRVLEALCDCVAEIHGVDLAVSSSLWYPENCWKNAVTAQPASLRSAFLSLLQGPQMAEVVARPLVALALAALERGRAACRAARPPAPRLLSPCPPAVIVAPHAATRQFGSWLLLQLFCSCEHARAFVVKQLVLRIGQAAEAASESLFVLSQISEQCFDGLLGVAGELRECLSHLQHLQPFAAGKLVEVLSPQLGRCATLSDRCALALRKATFSQDGQCRQAAVSALVALLRGQVAAALSTGGLQRGGRASLETIRGGPAALALDEVLQLLRRFMKHQAPVRRLLYALLHQLQRQHPQLRDLVLQMLLSHTRSIVRESRSSSRSAHGAPGSTQAPGGRPGQLELDLAGCMDSSGRPQERPLHLLCSLFAVAASAGEQGLSQGGATLASTQHSSDLQARADALSLLWHLCYSTGGGDLLDFGIDASEDDERLCSATDYSKLLLLLDCTRACAACVLALPAELSGGVVSASERLAVAGRLARRMAALQGMVATQQLLQKAAAKELRRSGDGEDSGGLRSMLAVTEIYKAEAVVPPPLHVASCELLFAVTCLDLLAAAAGPEQQDHHAHASLGSLSLARALDGIESLLAFLEDSAALAHCCQVWSPLRRNLCAAIYSH